LWLGSTVKAAARPPHSTKYIVAEAVRENEFG
jgi:hypothetical protein